MVISMVSNGFDQMKNYFQNNSDSIFALENHSNKQVISKANEVSSNNNRNRNKYWKLDEKYEKYDNCIIK